MNYLVLLGAGLIPMIIGSIYYGPIFGNAWMKSLGKTKEDLEGGNMAVIFGLAYVLSCALAMGMAMMSIHQNGVMQLFATHPDFAVAGTEVNNLYTTIMDNYGERHRTFGHGAVHGVFAWLLVAMPLIVIISLFERKTWKNIGINVLYWLIVLALMGGVVCQWV